MQTIHCYRNIFLLFFFNVFSIIVIFNSIFCSVCGVRMWFRRYVCIIWVYFDYPSVEKWKLIIRFVTVHTIRNARSRPKAAGRGGRPRCLQRRTFVRARCELCQLNLSLHHCRTTCDLFDRRLLWWSNIFSYFFQWILFFLLFYFFTRFAKRTGVRIGYHHASYAAYTPMSINWTIKNKQVNET
jgi:hypothetical protein